MYRKKATKTRKPPMPPNTGPIIHALEGDDDDGADDRRMGCWGGEGEGVAFAKPLLFALVLVALVSFGIPHGPSNLTER